MTCTRARGLADRTSSHFVRKKLQVSRDHVQLR